MPEIKETKARIVHMSEVALGMWQTCFAAFMEHDVDLISEALQKENELNDLEKEITTQLIEIGRQAKSDNERNRVLLLKEIVADFELIGDYIKDILERIAIKIEEKLLFSEEALKEYTELYKLTEGIFIEINSALKKGEPYNLNIELKVKHIDSIVDEYRSRHNERLISGVCQAFAGNMYLNMLDFTAAVYYHAKKIARNILKINQ